MTLYNQIKMGGVSSYETPLVKTLEFLSEGLLCVSFGDANQAGKELTEDNEWNM